MNRNVVFGDVSHAERNSEKRVESSRAAATAAHLESTSEVFVSSMGMTCATAPLRIIWEATAARNDLLRHQPRRLAVISRSDRRVRPTARAMTVGRTTTDRSAP